MHLPQKLVDIIGWPRLMSLKISCANGASPPESLLKRATPSNKFIHRK